MIGKAFRFLIPKLFVIASLVLAFWIGDVTLKEMDRGKRIQEEIASLRAEAQKTQKENTVLREKIQYFQTDDFKTQEARTKLNYQSENERAVVIKSGVADDAAKTQEIVPVEPKAQDFSPNYEKWLKQFFAA
ncbi:MAG: septum formation initiator family protein [Candidatus Moranbacteria bacterium]|nr:septum formation initiator family protein [Candidatus Moranbacteria bacterium]